MKHYLLPFLAAAALALAACGDDEPPPPLVATTPATTPAATASASPSALGTAAARTASGAPEFASVAAMRVAEQPSYQFTFEMALRGIPELAGGAFTFTGSGAVDQQAQRMSMTMDFRALRDLLALSGEATSPEIEAMFGDGMMEMRQEGNTAYVRMPMLSQLFGVATPWVAMTAPAGETPDFGAMSPLGGLGGLGGLGTPGSPEAFLEYMRHIDSSIRTVGTEAVRGVTTTHYAGTLDLAALLQQAPEAQGTDLNSMLQSAGAGSYTFPYDVWIDGEGLPRRMALTFDFSAMDPTAPAGAAMVFSFEMFAYGEPVTVELPPSSEVTVIDPATLGLGF